MRIKYDHSDNPNYEGYWIDLDDFFSEEFLEECEDEEIPKQLVLHILALHPGCLDADKFYLDKYETDGGHLIDIPVGKPWWLRTEEAVLFAKWTNSQISWSSDEVERAHAFLDDDWDEYITDYEDLGDKIFHETTAPNDEALGKELVSEVEGDLPDWAEPYFNYEEYAESFLEDRTVIEWGMTRYILSY